MQAHEFSQKFVCLKINTSATRIRVDSVKRKWRQAREPILFKFSLGDMNKYMCQ